MGGGKNDAGSIICTETVTRQPEYVFARIILSLHTTICKESLLCYVKHAFTFNPNIIHAPKSKEGTSLFSVCVYACFYQTVSLTWQDVLVAVLVHVLVQLGGVAGYGGRTVCLEGRKLQAEAPVRISVQLLHIG